MKIQMNLHHRFSVVFHLFPHRPSVILRSLIVLFALGCWQATALAAQGPLKVFVLVGQSNMQGHAHVRTFEHIGMDPETAPLLQSIQGEDGLPRVFDDVWISSLSSDGEKHGRLTAGFGADTNKIGPELTFGVTMQKMLNEPILIIKAAWGGKSLHTDFRPPSAGPYEFTQFQLDGFKKQGKDLETIKAEKAAETGRYYRMTIEHVKGVLTDIRRVYPDYQPDTGYELAGFVWFQGWNDMVDRGVYPDRDKAGGYDAYSAALACLIRDVRNDLKAQGLPFVIGVLGVGGPVDRYLPEEQRYSGIHQNFRDAMAAPATLPEFAGSVRAVLTEKYWDMELVGLRARESRIQREISKLQSDGKLSPEDAQKARERHMAEGFTPRERETLRKGVSNQEYHYLGSAKIMGQIGRAFAEAIVEIKNTGK